MKIIFLTGRLKERDGGSRAVLNFAKGIRRLSNHEPVIIALNNQISRDKLEGIQVIDLKKNLDIINSFELLVGSSLPLNIFRDYLKEDGIYIVTRDELVSLSQFKQDLIYWSQGVLVSIFFWEPFYKKRGVLSALASPFLWYNIKKFTEYIKNYKLMLANSKTSAIFISLFYNRSPKGVVYPPLDIEFFRPSKDKERFILAILKRGYPSQVELLAKIAERVRMKVIGYKIPNAEYYEKVSDEELRDLYSSALVTLYPASFEYFGYIPVESMASGTPVIAFRYSGGPAETIVDGETGWLASDEEEFYKLTLKVYNEGYPEEMIIKSRKRAELFSIENQTKTLLSFIV